MKETTSKKTTTQKTTIAVEKETVQKKATSKKTTSKTTTKTTPKKTAAKKTTTTKTTKKTTTKTTTPAPKIEKKRLIVSYKNLQEQDMELFNTTYADGFMNYIQKIEKPDGTPMFLVPLETEQAYLMVKVEVKVDDRLTDDDFDKEYDEKEQETTLDDIENGKENQSFKLIHGDYSTEDRMIEEQANKDMSEEDNMNIDDIDEDEVIDPDTLE